MITITSEDLFSLGADVLVCPVNCLGVAGAGLARAFRLRWPAWGEAYLQAYKDKKIHPGEIWMWREPQSKTIVASLPTKEHYLDNSPVELIERSLKRFAEILRASRPRKIAVPALGCGLGKLSFDVVRPVIEEHLKDLSHDIYVCLPR